LYGSSSLALETLWKTIAKRFVCRIALVNVLVAEATEKVSKGLLKCTTFFPGLKRARRMV
jgi:hypothetical protein